MTIEERELIAYNKGFLDGRKSRESGPLVGYAKRVMEVVCEYFEVDFSQLVTPSRRQQLCYPRQVIMYLLKINTKMGPVAIARTFNRDHGTVWKAVRTIENWIDTDEYRRRDIQILTEKINQCLHT